MTKTKKKRTRNKGKNSKTKTASGQASEAGAAKQEEKALEAQLQQLQIGVDDNSTHSTTCSHGFVVAKFNDKEKEMITKQTLAECDNLALSKANSTCDFEAIDRFFIALDLSPSPSRPTADGVMSRIHSYMEHLIEEAECNIDIAKMGMSLVMCFAYIDPEEKGSGISQSVSSHSVAAGVRHLIQGDIETARAYAYFNCMWEQLGSLVKRTKSVDFTKVVEMRMNSTNLRTLFSYFKNRIPCSCLDKRYKTIKSTKKIGFCFNALCSNITDPKSLLCCSYCRQANYCSIECQAADWKAIHKKTCAHFKNAASAMKSVTERISNDNIMSFEDFKKGEYFKECNLIEQAVLDILEE